MTASSVVQSIWLDAGAERAVYSFVRSHRDQVRKARMYLPPDVRWVHLFDDPFIENKIHTKMMTKLVDLGPALERLPYDSSCSGAVQLQIAGEETAPWNGDPKVSAS